MSIRNVAVTGASGNVGVPLVNALHHSGFHVTALTRINSKATFPSYANVLVVDYTSIKSITAALTGQDAVISCLSSTVLYFESNLVEAAMAAGVKRFIPGHFSADMRNEKSKFLAIMKPTIALQEKLITISQQSDAMTYTFVFTGGFLELCLGDGFIANVKEGKATLKDGGDRLINLTTIGTVAKSLVTVLQHQEETKNRSVFLSEVVLTQNKVVAMAKKIDPNKKWTIDHVDTQELERQAVEASKAPNPPLMTMVGSVFRMYFGGPDFGMPFKKNDHVLLGITEMNDEELNKVTEGVMFG